MVGVPDEMLGEAIRAFVVLDEGASLTEQQVKRECMARLESFMVPRDVVFVPRAAEDGDGQGLATAASRTRRRGGHGSVEERLIRAQCLAPLSTPRFVPFAAFEWPVSLTAIIFDFQRCERPSCGREWHLHTSGELAETRCYVRVAHPKSSERRRFGGISCVGCSELRQGGDRRLIRFSEHGRFSRRRAGVGVDPHLQDGTARGDAA